MPRGPGRQTRTVGEVVAVTGPIGAGKSSVAAALARRLAASGRTAAVADLDDVWVALQGEADLAVSWTRARAAHAALVAGWEAAGVDVVVVHGPFATLAERAPLQAGLPAEIRVRWAVLDVSYEAALARVADDPERGLSRDPDFLLQTHERYGRLAHELPIATWRFDTTRVGVDEIATVIAGDLGGPPAS